MTLRASNLLAELPRLRRYARFLVDDPLRADDIVEATLARARRRVGELPQGFSLRVHLLALLRAAYAEEFAPGRRRSNGSSAETRVAHRASAAGAAAASGVPADRARDLLAELLALPLEQREILVLVAVERMRYDDIATLLGVPVATVVARLVEARANLHQHATLGHEAPRSAR